MKKILILPVLVLFLSGCVTMYRGMNPTKEITVKTEPKGARVICSNQEFITPGILSLARNRSYQISISKEGYKTVYVNVNSKVKTGAVGSSFLANTGAWGWWTLGIGTAIGMIIDSFSGSLKDLNTDSIFIPLTSGEGEITLNSSDLIKT